MIQISREASNRRKSVVALKNEFHENWAHRTCFWSESDSLDRWWDLSAISFNFAWFHKQSALSGRICGNVSGWKGRNCWEEWNGVEERKGSDRVRICCYKSFQKRLFCNFIVKITIYCLQSNRQQSWKRSAWMAMKVIKTIDLKMILNCSLKNVSISRNFSLKRSHV
jgi:hypothetical protein